MAVASAFLLFLCEYNGPNASYSVCVSGSTLWADVIPSSDNAGWRWAVRRLPGPGVNWLPSLEESLSHGYFSIGIPLWMPAMALLALLGAIVAFTRAEYPPGHCRTCGYDLTGNVSGVCPECGTAIARSGESKPKESS